MEVMKRGRGIFRTALACTLVLAVTLTYILRLYDLQFVKGADYIASLQAANVRKVSVDAARGEILDTNGNPVVINRMGYSVVFEYAYFPSAKQKSERNQIIAELTRLLEEKGEVWNDSLPLHIENGVPAFEQESERAVKQLKNALELNDYATAQNCMDALVEKYELQEYPADMQRKIGAVAYSMTAANFSVSNPYTFAEDVDDETVLKIKENSTFFKGVEVQVEPYREYVDGTLAPHVIGMVGAISAEEYAVMKNDNYGMNDTVGKDGIEKAMENNLRGIKGEKAITTEYDGNISTQYTKEPVQGDTVVLTLNMNFQRAAQNALEETIQDLNRRYLTSGGRDGGRNSGCGGCY